MAHPRPHGRGDARLLRAAWNFFAGTDRRPLAGRWRAGQSGAGITRARLAGDPPDLLISPRVGQIGWFDFHRADDLIAHGTRAAERAIESIQEAIGILAPPSAKPAAAPAVTAEKTTES